MDGPSSPITSAPASIFADQTFNLADYPPGDNVVIGNKEKYFKLKKDFCIK